MIKLDIVVKLPINPVINNKYKYSFSLNLRNNNPIRKQPITLTQKVAKWLVINFEVRNRKFAPKIAPNDINKNLTIIDILFKLQ